ncbi:MAG: hypothetical protein PHC75_08675 [Burkholderiales bacterium]|nr:hypothetical protein [Burkholderiales bacterium]
MFFYVELNENNICIGVSQLAGEVEAGNMILLDSYDLSLLGKKYNNGIWEEVEPTPEPTPTEQEMINAELLTTLNTILLKINGTEASE